MIIIHRSGVIIEVASITKIRPISINKVNGILQVEITYDNGNTDNFDDLWYAKDFADSFVSIYTVIIPKAMLRFIDLSKIFKEIPVR